MAGGTQDWGSSSSGSEDEAEVAPPRTGKGKGTPGRALPRQGAQSENGPRPLPRRPAPLPESDFDPFSAEPPVGFGADFAEPPASFDTFLDSASGGTDQPRRDETAIERSMREKSEELHALRSAFPGLTTRAEQEKAELKMEILGLEIDGLNIRANPRMVASETGRVRMREIAQEITRLGGILLDISAGRPDDLRSIPEFSEGSLGRPAAENLSNAESLQEMGSRGEAGRKRQFMKGRPAADEAPPTDAFENSEEGDFAQVSKKSKPVVQLSTAENHEHQSQQRHAAEHFWALNWGGLKDTKYLGWLLDKNRRIGSVVNAATDWAWRNVSPWHRYYDTNTVQIDLTDPDNTHGNSDLGVFATQRRKIDPKTGAYQLRYHTAGDIFSGDTSAFKTFNGWSLKGWGTYIKTGYTVKSRRPHNVTNPKKAAQLGLDFTRQPDGDVYGVRPSGIINYYVKMVGRVFWFPLYKATPIGFVSRSVMAATRLVGYGVKTAIRDLTLSARWLALAAVKVVVALPLVAVAGVVAFVNARLLDQHKGAPAEKRTGRISDFFANLGNKVGGKKVGHVNNSVVRGLTALWRNIDLENPMPYMKTPLAIAAGVAIGGGLAAAAILSGWAVPVVLGLHVTGAVAFTITTAVVTVAVSVAATALVWSGLGAAIATALTPVFNAALSGASRLFAKTGATPSEHVDNAYNYVKKAATNPARSIKNKARSWFGRRREDAPEHMRIASAAAAAERSEMDYRTVVGEDVVDFNTEDPYPDAVRALAVRVNAGEAVISPTNQLVLEGIRRATAKGRVQEANTTAILDMILANPETDVAKQAGADRVELDVYSQEQEEIVIAPASASAISLLDDDDVSAPEARTEIQWKDAESAKYSVKDLFGNNPSIKSAPSSRFTGNRQGNTQVGAHTHASDDGVARNSFFKHQLAAILTPSKEEVAVKQTFRAS